MGVNGILVGVLSTHDREQLTVHRCPFPIAWLMKIEGFEETPLTTGLFDDRWYTKPSSLFLPKGHLISLAKFSGK
jgi:hypothetical protein